jgi:hypothetical protein
LVVLVTEAFAVALDGFAGFVAGFLVAVFFDASFLVADFALEDFVVGAALRAPAAAFLAVEGLSRVEQAVALLALLELRKAGEIGLSQAQPFAPIRVSRADSERIAEWTARSA